VFKKLLSFRNLQSILFLAILTVNGLVSGLFLELVHFRALSGWEDEINFDSLTFNWKLIRTIAWAVTALGMAGVLGSFFSGNFYRRWGWALALVFLTGVGYPWGLTFHYVRSFHFILLFGIVINAYGFLVLAFFKRQAGLAGETGEKSKKVDAFKQISVEEAGEMLKAGKALFVDVRDPNSFAAAHVPGALHLNDDNIQDFVAKTDKSKPVVCYCYHGNTSQGAAAYLIDQGFQEVYSVMGGFEEWRQTEKIES
jgi:thiosulfate sulfurtransferase